MCTTNKKTNEKNFGPTWVVKLRGNRTSSPCARRRLFPIRSPAEKNVVDSDQAPLSVMTRGNQRIGVNRGPRDPSLNYTDSVEQREGGSARMLAPWAEHCRRRRFVRRESG